MLAEGSGQDLDGDMRVRGAGLHAPLVYGLKDPTHAAFADELDESKSTVQYIAHRWSWSIQYRRCG